MMVDYHIGTLDAASRKTIESGEDMADASAEPRAVFLQPKQWTKASLTSKTAISSDTKIFTFALDHPTQSIGLPIGQHLLMRLRDPVTREAIIRAYTPISDAADARGTLDVLVKIYRGSADGSYKGGAMTMALDSIPLGHWVEFKGPVGKFEYLGRGRCTVGGKAKTVKRFYMVCAGSGITPIFAVLRAVMKDAGDETECVVLNGNRFEEDILCRREMEELTAGKANCRVVNTLSQPSAEWTGARGRIDRALFEREVGAPSGREEERGRELVLVCGPGPLETSVKNNFEDMGWKEEDLLFF